MEDREYHWPLLDPDRTRVSDPLSRALGLVASGGMADKEVVAELLGDAFKLPVDRFNDDARDFLLRLLVPLENAMVDPPAWLEGDTDRHTLVARAAIEDIPTEHLVALGDRFGWRTKPMRGVREPTMQEAVQAIRDFFVHRLGQRIFDAMRQWEKDGAWPATVKGRKRPA